MLDPRDENQNSWNNGSYCSTDMAYQRKKVRNARKGKKDERQ